MRISDWSSDVCSSDLLSHRRHEKIGPLDRLGLHSVAPADAVLLERPEADRAFRDAEAFARQAARGFAGRCEERRVHADRDLHDLLRRNTPTFEALAEQAVGRDDAVEPRNRFDEPLDMTTHLRSEEHTYELKSLM